MGKYDKNNDQRNGKRKPTGLSRYALKLMSRSLAAATESGEAVPSTPPPDTASQLPMPPVPKQAPPPAAVSAASEPRSPRQIPVDNLSARVLPSAPMAAQKHGKFIIDEHLMPKDILASLQAIGLDCVVWGDRHPVSAGQRPGPRADWPDLFAAARNDRRTIITADLPFGYPERYDLASIEGLVVLPFPVGAEAQSLKKAVAHLTNDVLAVPHDWHGSVVIYNAESGNVQHYAVRNEADQQLIESQPAKLRSIIGQFDAPRANFPERALRPPQKLPPEPRGYPSQG